MIKNKKPQFDILKVYQPILAHLQKTYGNIHPRLAISPTQAGNFSVDFRVVYSQQGDGPDYRPYYPYNSDPLTVLVNLETGVIA